VFIFEPVLFVVLLIALVAPALFGLINSEVGARRETFRGRGWAIFALAAMVGLWGWREVEHNAAEQLASAANYGPAETAGAAGGADSVAQVLPAQVLRVTASPYPGNPYRWHTVVETPGFYQMATVDTLHSTVATDPEQDLFYKPPTTLAGGYGDGAGGGDWRSGGYGGLDSGAVYGPAVPVRHAFDAGAQRAAALGDGVCGCGPEGGAHGDVRARAAIEPREKAGVFASPGHRSLLPFST
jgi:hypothetical protein